MRICDLIIPCTLLATQVLDIRPKTKDVSELCFRAVILPDLRVRAARMAQIYGLAAHQSVRMATRTELSCAARTKTLTESETLPHVGNLLLSACDHQACHKVACHSKAGEDKQQAEAAGE